MRARASLAAALCLLGLGWFFWAQGAELAAHARYYAIFYSYDDSGKRPTRSHTFAVFIKEPARGKPEFHTLSWLPDDGDVRLLALQHGKNHTLEETLAIAGDRPVLAFGPYRIREWVYRAALERIRFLDSGAVLYKMFDWRSHERAFQAWEKRASEPPGKAAGAINCIHAVSDLVGDLDTGEKWGELATREVVRAFTARSAILEAGRGFPEIAERLGLPR